MRNRLKWILPLSYLVIVGFCIWQATDYSIGRFDWFGVCMVLTLPWSVFTFLMIMGAIHVVGDTGIFIAQAASALLNAGLLSLFLRARSRNDN